MIRSLLLGFPLLLAVIQDPAPGPQEAYSQAIVEIQAGHGQKAIGFLNEAVKANPKPSVTPRYTPYFYLGLCYDSIGDEKNALIYYDKSNSLKELQAFPDDQEVLRTNLDELRESARTFQVILKDKTPTPPQKQDAGSTKGVIPTTAPPKKDVAAVNRPPVEPGIPKPPVASLAEPHRDLDRVLRQAVLDYLSGNYASALQEARRYLDEGGRQVEKASFLAGASLFSQYLLAGQKDEGMERRADLYLKAANPYSPPGAWISPAVLERYKQVSKR